ncbi:B3 domain-containing transcription factor VRN1-like [Hibiscus syriacus]|uniref:B3 domain-containing transcription factor VRN1-like n=1 Tax=Hibiscus syriacus TaxID=106335 RepID=UPI0019212C0E|nr:B3 domain-containing transcription factor VRN1-like [Hibiscus syriacus]
MASNSNPNSQAFTSRTPHFFKVLLTDAIQHGKMKIPAKFVRKYGSGISSPVFLKVPSGTLWEVELTKSGSEVYLQKGWSDFVQHYSLDLEDFVVFRYGGHSLFNVIIFDKGASEIEYIHAENHTLSEQCQGTAVKQEKDDDDISVEIIDGTPTLPREKRRGPLPSPCPRLSRLSASSRKSNGGMSASPEHGGGSMRGTMRGKQKDKACQIASSFKSQNPFFTRVMQPSFLTDKYRMGLPIIFARKYLTEKKCKIQCVVDGKTWTMEYNNTSKRFVPRLCNGWKGFSIDNKLDVGDVCVFELISIVETTFNVFIFRREVAESVDFPNSLVDENGANPVKFKKSLGTDYGSKSKGAISFIDDDKAAVEEYQLPGGKMKDQVPSYPRDFCTSFYALTLCTQF